MKVYSGSDIVNIGTGQGITIKELALLINKVVGYEGEIIFDASKPDGTPVKVSEISRIKSLGWLPKITLKEGLGRTYAWYVRNN
jgi:GDP-L-fucose synthase